jgi:predicted TIM-barrel enzyme
MYRSIRRPHTTESDRPLTAGDGAVVGAALMEDGVFRNPLDVERVRRLMAAVRRERPTSVAGGGA